MSQKVFNNGNPFYSFEKTLVNGIEKDSLIVFLDDIIERVKIGKASLIIIDGGVGEGKTTFGVHVADYVNKKYDLEVIEFDSFQYSIGGTTFLKNLVKCYENKLPVVIYDEAGDFNKRRSLTNFNHNLNRAFEVFRALKVLVIVILPSFSVLDSDLFTKGVVRGLIHLHSRTEDKGEFSVYDVDRCNWIRNYMKQLPTKNLAYAKVYRNIGGKFYDLEPQRCRALDVVSTKGKVDIFAKSELELGGFSTLMDIAKKLSRSKDTIKNYIYEMKLEPDRKYKRLHYFSNDNVEKIREFMEREKLRNAKKDIAK